MLETNILKMAIYQKCQTALKISDSFLSSLLSAYFCLCIVWFIYDDITHDSRRRCRLNTRERARAPNVYDYFMWQARSLNGSKKRRWHGFWCIYMFVISKNARMVIKLNWKFSKYDTRHETEWHWEKTFGKAGDGTSFSYKCTAKYPIRM